MLDLTKLGTLLWDTDPSQVDLERHAGFLIRRSLERGTWAEWKMIRAHYGDQRIREELQTMRHLDPKALAYVAAVLGQPPESFPCYTTESSPTAPWKS